ncbi:EF-hand domain-containing protein [Brevundimonas bacteroides]|uniref:EF-hand domain-containing protein n=1 Tax=Brevundimonas bacteroides TaxID=74311 RepID=UPI00068AED34|nr:EF-hand domain-containing protein [Brevundimonas bacteroides]
MRLVLCLASTMAMSLAACAQEERVEAAAVDPAPIEEPADAPEEAFLEEAALDVEPLPPRPLPPRPAQRRQAEQGPMTLEQMLARAERGFDRADADSDGVVTTAELDAAAETLPNARNWSRADRDGDGRLTKDEFRSVVAWRFERMDADGDGSVSVEERQARRGGEAD